MDDDNKALTSALGTDVTPKPFKEPDYSKIKTLPQVLAEQQRVGDLTSRSGWRNEKSRIDPTG
jgi:hypothetical protein